MRRRRSRRLAARSIRSRRSRATGSRRSGSSTGSPSRRQIRPRFSPTRQTPRASPRAGRLCPTRGRGRICLRATRLRPESPGRASAGRYPLFQAGARCPGPTATLPSRRSSSWRARRRWSRPGRTCRAVPRCPPTAAGRAPPGADIPERRASCPGSR